MGRLSKKIIAAFLIAAVLVSYFPVSAYATDSYDGDVPCNTEGCTLGYGHEGDCDSQQSTDCETEGCTLGYGHEGDCNNPQQPTDCGTEGCTLGYGHDGECNNQQPTDCETEGCTLGYGHEGDCNNPQQPTDCGTEGCTLGYGHDGECNNQQPTDCETEGCTLGYGHEGDCNGISLLEGEEQIGADPISVFLSLTVNGELQKSKDGNYLAFRELTISDADKDGDITLLDVVHCLHEQHFASYTEEVPGYSAESGAKGINEIWGLSKSDRALKNCYFTVLSHGTAAKSPKVQKDSALVLDQSKVTDHSYISISASDTSAPNPNFFISYAVGTSSSAVIMDISIPSGKSADIALAYKATSGLAKKQVGYQIYCIDSDGNLAELKDENGENVVTKRVSNNAICSVAFDKAGDYILVAEGKAKKEGAAVLRVHVYDDSCVEVSNVFAALTDDAGSESLLTYNPDVHEYTIEVPENTSDIFGKVDFNVLQQMGSGIKAKYEYYNGAIWLCVSGESGALLKCTVSFGEAYRFSVSDEYVGNGLFASYTINVKKTPILTGITSSNLILTETFTPNQNSYIAILPTTAESLNLTLSADAQHTATVNGMPVVIGTENEISLESLSFDTDGKAELTIQIADPRTENFTENTYQITVYKAKTEAVPTFIGIMKNGEYIVGDQAAALNALASASGLVTYQWYRGTEASTEGAAALEGETTSTFTPPTEEAGTFYYYCVATNSATDDTATSEFAKVTVYPDPTPTLRWIMEIPPFSQEQLEYLQQKHPNGQLPDAALVDGQYCGYYYRARQEDVTPLTAEATSAAGDVTYHWDFWNAIGGGGQTNFYLGGGSYTPDVSTSNGARLYSVRAACELLGRTFWSEYIYVYVYTDSAMGTAPDNLSWAGQGTQDSPWLLSSQKDLEELSFYVNQGYTFENKFLQFANDISLDLTWKGLGRDDGNISSDKGKLLRVFSGTLDGGGHTLTYAKGSEYPLFNYARETTVQNLNILAPYIANYGLVANYVVDYGEDGDYNIGSSGSYAPGCPDTIEIRNVTILSGSIIQRSGFIGGGASGGNTVTILNCTVQSGVKIGCNEDGSSAELPIIGSFAGSISGTVTNCTSSADVYGSNNVSGIVSCKSQSMGYFSVRNCVFLGNVYATGTMAGGIVAAGYMADSAPNSPCVSIENCYVAGSISGKNYVGGILGGEAGVVQAWSNGKGNIKNNFFYGKLSSSGSYVGGIAGYVRSLDKYNCIENNYFLDTCGTEKGIGGVQVVDTSSAAQHPAWVDGVYYINTAGASEAYMRAVDYELYGNNTWERVKVPDSNRTDDPLGADADKLAKAMTAKQFADGTVTLLLNQHPDSSKNWGQGELYPTHNGAKVAVHLEVSGTYSTTVEQGKNLDLTGMIVTATWSDGSTSEISLKNIEIRGFDKNTVGEQTVTLVYGAATKEITVTVRPKSTKITVTVSLLGDHVHDSDSDGVVHVLSKNNLETWLAPAAYEADASETVWGLLQRVFSANGFSCDNPTGNYIRAINGLAEFTNGKNSGWMYTLNGTHPALGVNQQYMKDGDVIVFHYTDDYTKEEGSWPDNNPATAKDVIDLIDKIGNVTYTDACKAKIDAARKAYDALSAEEKAKVTNYKKLTDAEDQYKKLKAADDKAKAKAVDDLISKIGTVTINSGAAINAAWNGYNKLTAEQKELVTKLSTLQEATRKWNQLKADEVIKLIDKIEDPVTEKSKTSIEAARKAYDALTKAQKDLVTNVKKLTDAETAYAKLTASEEDKEKAQEVIDLIDKLKDVTPDSEKDIEAARKAYDALTDLQKKLVDNYDVLTAAETKLAMLKTMGKVSDPYITTGDYMEALGTPSVGTIGGEWMVIGLARSDRNIPGVEDYYKKVLEYVAENIDPETGRLHKAKSTDNSRIILALTAIGRDVTNVGGYDLLQGLSDLEFVKYQGNNGPIWALLALDSGNYPAPTGGTTTRQALIDEILSVQTSDGGWTVSGDKADSDMTGMALTALAPYYTKDLKVQEAIDKAIARLSEMQDEDGGYSTSYDGTTKIATSESISQVVTALSALGINADTDPRFVKNGNSVIDALLRYYVKGGGFKHIMDGELDGMATEQAYYALTAYYRFLTGQTNLYDMTDIIDMGGDPVEPTVPATTEPTEVEPAKTGFPWWILVICVVGGCGLGMVIAIVIIPKFGKFKKKD